MADLTGFRLEYLPDNPKGVYLVGGTVRDLLAGSSAADVDLAVTGDIRDIARTIAHKTGGRIVDLGKKGFPVLRIAGTPIVVDITPLDHGGIASDLLKRDFTINAMAVDLHTRQLVDITGGLADLRSGCIRMVSPAVFEADPARLLRAFRMAASLEFSIDAKTLQAVSRNAHRIGSVAGERIWADLVKFFAVGHTTTLMAAMADSGLLTAIFPELEPTRGCIQNQYHQWDVFEHSLRTYGHLETLLREGASESKHEADSDQAEMGASTPILKYSALLHDVGKPIARRTNADGRPNFHGHAIKGAEITDAISRRLRLSARQRQDATGIIHHHLWPLLLFQASQKGTFGRRAAVRFFNQCGGLTRPIIMHSRADTMAKKSTIGTKEKAFMAFCDELLSIYADYHSRKAARPPLINGHDLIGVFGLSPCPRFATILELVNERQLAGELTSRAQALAWVEAYIAKTEDG